MSNISIKVNLRQLEHGFMTTKKGVKCIVLPIKENNLFEGEKGVYLDMQAWEIDPDKRSADRKDTHIVSQSLSKEVRDALPDGKYPPTLGNAIDWNQQGGSSTLTPEAQDFSGDDGQDLPF